MVDVVWLDMTCSRCHGVVEAQFTSWHPDGPVDDGATWICPHCGSVNALGVTGHVTVVAVRADQDERAVNQW